MMFMRLKLKIYDDKGKVIEEKIMKTKEEGEQKIIGKKYYQFHKCRHDETPPKPCTLIKQKLPVVEEIIKEVV